MNQLNDLMANYSTLAIALLLMILLVLLYIIIKQKSDKPQDLKEHEEVIPEAHKHINIFATVKESHEHQEKPAEEELHKEEPKEEEAKTEEAKEAGLQPKVPGSKIIKKKREYIPHGPVTKESFNIFAGLKILVAEDNLINQKVINGVLGDSGMHVVMADNGQEALDILKNEKDFSIVLMDAHMPVMDGFEATKNIRADDSLDHVLVVALSGDTATDDIKKMSEAGMQEHLEKPLKMEKLYEILYSYIDMKESAQSEEKNEAQILNIDEGIEICGSDSDLYKEVLSEFLTMYKDADQKIKSYMAKDQIDSIKRLLLDISGISANIGADKLAEVSTEFREVLNNNQEDKFFNAEKQFHDIMNKVIEDIENYMH